MSSLGNEEALVLKVVDALCADLQGHVVKPAGLDSDLRTDLALDSLSIVELVDRINTAAGVDLGEEVLEHASTPRDLARAVRQATEGPSRAPALHAREPLPRPVPSPVAPPPGAMAGVGTETFTTLTEALARQAAARPDQVTIRLLGGDASDMVEEITYGSLLAEADTIARALVYEGLSPGERVAMILATERAYFTVFLGILLAGGIPVPLYPPATRAALAEHLNRLAGVLRNSGAAVVVTLPEATGAARLLAVQVPSLRSVRTPAELVERGQVQIALPAVRPDDPALIQYTSGSTADPKGVVLTHAQLLANIRAMARAASLTSDDVVVSWLPLYHDMGLIGVWHTPLVMGVPLVVMSPLAFLARPVRWLEAISKYGGTISAAPNFAFHECTRRIPERDMARLDLSHWRIAFNGSEPVRTSTIDEFVERFSPVGFRRESMCPAYGLAEAGVGVAFSPLGRGPRVDTVSRLLLARTSRAVPVPQSDPDALEVVGCGYPLPGYEVMIAGEGGNGRADREEGRVLCRGPSLTAGYFANEAATRALWQNGWLDTGDLGYIADGELFLTGRAKDLIIRGGRNVHPEDLEGAMRDIDGLVPDAVAAFASADPRHQTERLVLVAETAVEAADRRAAIEEAIRRRAAALLGLPPEVIVLVPPGAIRRTPSGKIRRNATREVFEKGQLGKAPPAPWVQLAEVAWSGLGPARRRVASWSGKLAFAFSAWAVALGVAVPVCIAVHLPLPLEDRWRFTRGAARTISRITGIPVTVDGALPPRSVPAIVVANHASFIDAVLLIIASPDPLTFVTSTDFEFKPVIGSFLRRLGCTFVARGDPTRTAEDVGALAALVRSGCRLAIFPEGSLNRAPGLRPFHLGAFAVASDTGCPLVPVAIRGARGVLRPGSLLPHPGPVSVVVGDPVDPPVPGFAAEAAVAETVRRTLALQVGEPLVGGTAG